MPCTLFAGAIALALLQPTGQSFVGTWIAELSGTTYARLELTDVRGTLTGKLSLGDIRVDSRGEVQTATPAPRELTPILDITVRDSTLSFSRKDGNDTDRFELKRVGDLAELQFVLSDADRRALAESGATVLKPIRLKRVPRENPAPSF